jgi:hypothetical protein
MTQLFSNVLKHVRVRTKELPNLEFSVIIVTFFAKGNFLFEFLYDWKGCIERGLNHRTQEVVTFIFIGFVNQDLCELRPEIN